MEQDWDARARENALRWIAEVEDEGEFDRSGERDSRIILAPPAGGLAVGARVLEIGCGVGRIMKHMAPFFREVHGVDVSAEMVARGRERLMHLPNIFFHKNDGTRLSMFADETFDLVYSYIAFQHIPRTVVYGYFREVVRVLKAGGLFWFQMFRPHTIPHLIKYYVLRRDKPDSDTSGIRRYSRGELARMARSFRFQVLSIQRRGLHWLCTLRKPGGD